MYHYVLKMIYQVLLVEGDVVSLLSDNIIYFKLESVYYELDHEEDLCCLKVQKDHSLILRLLEYLLYELIGLTSTLYHFLEV